jgi:hypothetical protein
MPEMAHYVWVECRPKRNLDKNTYWKNIQNEVKPTGRLEPCNTGLGNGFACDGEEN